MFLALALVCVSSARAGADIAVSLEVTKNAVCESCVVSNALGGIKNFVLDNKKTVLFAAVVLGAIAYYVATAEDADADNI